MRLVSTNGSMSQTLIVAALRSGDLRRAVELLLENYQDDVYAYCARLVGPAEAARVYNAVLERAIAQLDDAYRNGSLRAWLYSVARTTIADHHRHSRRSGALELDYAPVDGPLDGPSVEIGDVDLQVAMNRLDAAAREVLQLTMWHGLSLQEVAQVTERPPSEVRALAARGLGRLSLELQAPEVQPS